MNAECFAAHYAWAKQIAAETLAEMPSDYELHQLGRVPFEAAWNNREAVIQKLKAELEYFIARVEDRYHPDGHIHSRKTYTRFKNVLTEIGFK